MTNFIRSVIFTLTLAFSLSFPAFCPTVFSQEVLNFGWTPPKEPPQVNEVWQSQLQELAKYNDGEDVLLYRYLYKALEDNDQLTNIEKETKRLESLDQGQFGHCVGAATARCIDILKACDIYIRNEPEKWVVESNHSAIYAIGRHDNRGNYDGSTGKWQTDALKKYGTLFNLDYGGGFDLKNLDLAKGREWAARGVPEELLKYASDHKVISCALVTTIDEAIAALQNGYPINTCSNVGYNSTRGQFGELRIQGSWAHSMAVVGYRSGKTDSAPEGFLILQSWGNNWCNGPIWNDQPHGAFWVSVDDFRKHLRYNDTWAIAGFEGFKRRELKWDEIFDIGGEIEED